jgi:hypothetical protein
VEFIPNEVEQDVLYISVEYKTAVHLCICGCGNKVVTRLSPTDWELRFDGKTITLSPSIGNWSFDCKAHYWIKKNKIYHAQKRDDWKIKKVRKKIAKTKRGFSKKKESKREPL